MQEIDFIKLQNYFSLGHLPTEQPHPETRNLSELVKTNLNAAIAMVQKIDSDAIGVAACSLPLLRELSHEIQNTISSGHKVYLSGCGATGRLALGLESLYRNVYHETALENSVRALMAGGDFALVKSVENFEDFPGYGIRHLADLGFQEGDLLIAITEGGETPYVIGTVQGALERSSRSPWFVYCNPRELLVKTVDRSRAVIENPRVCSLCLEVGPMALSGSTRLQAATAQMFSVGAALFANFASFDSFLNEFRSLDLGTFLSPIIEWESLQYLAGRTVLYETNSYPIAVLTDTTERSPTFSLAPFEKSEETDGVYSLCYLSVPDTLTAEEAWARILNREPIGLNWEEFQGKLERTSIYEFDFSRKALSNREKRLSPVKQSVIRVENVSGGILFSGEGVSSFLKTNLVDHPLLNQILIKLILNTLSLMVMGKLGRYEGNVMTWVRASNGKLIDRTLRYLEFLIEKRKLQPQSRETLIAKVFEMRDQITANDALVLKLLETIPAS